MRIVLAAASLAVARAADPWTSVNWEIASGSFNTLSASVAGLNQGAGGCLNVARHAVVLSDDEGTPFGCATIGENMWALDAKVYSDQGTATGTLEVPGYTILNNEGEPTSGEPRLISDGTAYNAYHHTVVVHAEDGTALSCADGVEDGAELTFSQFPGYSGDWVSGTVTVSAVSCANEPGDCVHLELDLDTADVCGADTTGNCGEIHLHTGTSCDAAANVGGHLFDKSVAIVLGYPDYSGSASVSGTVTVTNTGSFAEPEITLEANLKNGGGLGDDATGTLAIHNAVAASYADSACLVADDIGERMYAEEYQALSITTDPNNDPWWDVVWSTDALGCFNPQVSNQTVPNLSYDSSFPVLGDYNVNGHAAVVHNAEGFTIACGVINEDPWPQVRILADADGVATNVSMRGNPLYGFEISDDDEYSGRFLNAKGKAVVVLDSGSDIIGCGCCVGDDSIDIEPYLAYDPIENISFYKNANVTGTVGVSADDSGYIAFDPQISFLQPEAYGSVRVYDTDTCDDVEFAGTLFRRNGAQLGVFPGYEGEKVVLGFVDVLPNDDNSIIFSTSLVNGDGSGAVDSATVGGVHIHQGSTCDSNLVVGGHFWDNTATQVGVPGANTAAETTVAVAALVAAVGLAMH